MRKVEHAASVWWTGGKIASKRLEAVQDRVGRKLLGASRTEEKKMLYGRRVERLDDSRLQNGNE